MTSHRSGQVNTIVESTQNFEAWLAQRTRVVAPDLKFKHDQMVADLFAFMRATFYRWIQRWHIDCPAAYLSKEGYPYRIFAKAHPDLVKAASKLKPDAAMRTIVEAAGPIPAKKFATLFKLCLSAEERLKMGS